MALGAPGVPAGQGVATPAGQGAEAVVATPGAARRRRNPRQFRHPSPFFFFFVSMVFNLTVDVLASAHEWQGVSPTYLCFCVCRQARRRAHAVRVLYISTPRGVGGGVPSLEDANPRAPLAGCFGCLGGIFEAGREPSVVEAMVWWPHAEARRRPELGLWQGWDEMGWRVRRAAGPRAQYTRRPWSRCGASFRVNLKF